MRIALIHPRTEYPCENEQVDRYVKACVIPVFSRILNLNLLRIAALTPSHHEVELIDENIREIDFSRKYDLVGVTAMTFQADRAYEIAGKFREAGAPTILGGIHAALAPEEAGRHFDSVCLREVENCWSEILSDAERGALKSRYLAGDADLKQVPSPDYGRIPDLVRGVDFAADSHTWFFPVMTSRGCPRGCDYCSATYLFDRRVRKHDAERALDEVREVKRIAQGLGVRNWMVEFCDDNFLVDVKRSKGLLQKLADLGVRFTALMDIVAPDDLELIRLLKEAGCAHVCIGLEGLEEDTLEEFGKWKKAQLGKIEKNIDACFKVGLTPSVNFIVGSDRTQPAHFKGIGKFMQHFPIPMGLLFFTPFPGTRYARELDEAGRLRPEMKWSYYNLYNIVHETVAMPRERLYDEYCYLRYKYASPSRTGQG